MNGEVVAVKTKPDIKFLFCYELTQLLTPLRSNTNMPQETSISTSNTPQTSYPGGPSRTNPSRDTIVGGYVIDNATCVAWGSRIVGEPLNPDRKGDSIGALSVIMGKVEEKPYYARFIMFGTESCREYMVITQSAPFNGWKGMDPALIPKFEEGEREAIARVLLEAEGRLT